MYDVIVIGGGHAGSEACLASARKGKKTLLITGNLNMIASMPCNPSVGGPAKGVVVREIDALGGEMARNADKSLIQMRMLNISKGPAVRALRAQSDKEKYSKEMINTMKQQDNLELKEGIVTNLIIENETVTGVRLEKEHIYGKKVIITTGTYMTSKILVGDTVKIEGPDNEKTSSSLSECLVDLGFKLTRLKTGTPPRIRRDSIDFTVTEEHPGDMEYRSFSFDNKYYYDIDQQHSCYLTYTNLDTHDIIHSNLDKSSMYSGVVEGTGPRYCPSIEDKCVRFHTKERHQIFLEPDNLTEDEIYIQGFSTSMPYDIQERMVKSIKGLENAVINKYAYAIEYDAIDARNLYPTLESKIVKNLYFAGQVNGTSGYEEAACQGLMASINACLDLEEKPPFILKRNEAYIGVLIDDLVTKGVKDPYRLLTSRAEYRLLLRNDNADIRLMNYGYKLGLISEEKNQIFINKMQEIEELKKALLEYIIYPNAETNDMLMSIGTSKIKDKITLYQLLKRPEVTVNMMSAFISTNKYSRYSIEQVEIDVKYEGYIKKAKKQAIKLLKNDEYKIPSDIDYSIIENIALEAREKLNRIKPLNIGQASRISGVNPTDIQILLIYLKTLNRQ